MLFRAKSGLSYKFYLLIKIYVTTFRKQFAPDLIFKSKIEGEGGTRQKNSFNADCSVSKNRLGNGISNTHRKCAGLSYL